MILNEIHAETEFEIKLVGENIRFDYFEEYSKIFQLFDFYESNDNIYELRILSAREITPLIQDIERSISLVMKYSDPTDDDLTQKIKNLFTLCDELLKLKRLILSY